MPVVGRRAGQSRDTTVRVVTERSWVETPQTTPRFFRVCARAGPVQGAGGGAGSVLQGLFNGPGGRGVRGGGVGALLGPEGTGPALVASGVPPPVGVGGGCGVGVVVLGGWGAGWRIGPCVAGVWRERGCPVGRGVFVNWIVDASI